jgi:hypothetical protein
MWMVDQMPPVIDYAAPSRRPAGSTWHVPAVILVIIVQVCWLLLTGTFFEMVHHSPAPKRPLPDLFWFIAAGLPAIVRAGISLKHYHRFASHTGAIRGRFQFVLTFILAMVFITIVLLIWYVSEFHESTPWGVD